MLNAIRKLLNVGKGNILLGDKDGVARPIQLQGDVSIDHNGIVRVLKTISSKIGEYFSY